MSKRFVDFIRETRDEKATEKALISRAAMLVVVVVGCLAAMCLTAYAYFTYNITSDTNTLQAARFEANVSIQLLDANDQVIETIVPVKSGTWTYTATGLQVGKYYTVTVSPAPNNTATTGYIAVMAGGCRDIYHTQQLGADTTAPGGKRPDATFKLMVTDTTVVTFETRWGTSAYYPSGTDAEEYIVGGEEIKMVINGVENPQVIDDGEEEITPPVNGETPSDEVETTPPADEEVTPPTTAASTPNDTEADAPVQPEVTEPPVTEPEVTAPPVTEPPAPESSAAEENVTEPTGEVT